MTELRSEFEVCVIGSWFPLRSSASCLQQFFTPPEHRWRQFLDHSFLHPAAVCAGVECVFRNL